MTHAIPSSTQPQASAVSAVQLAASACAAQGSAGAGEGAPQSQGGQVVPAGQAGQTQIEAVPEPELGAVAVPVVDDAVPDGTVMVVVAPALHPQLQAGQTAPTGQVGQLHVQVPGSPPALPQVPPAPPLPVPPVPQSQLQAGQRAPGGQAGQPQVQVPPPLLPLPASTEGGGGGQSHLTGGQAPFAGQTSGCTQRQVLGEGARA